MADPVLIRDVAAALEEWAPPATSQSYDNVGLQVGRADRPVTRALIGLDMTPALLAEARKRGAELIITHHPLIFRKLKSVTGGGFVNELALSLAESGIALYAIHTNLDVAPGGVSFALAEQLGLSDLRFLSSLDDQPLRKLITWVPHEAADAVLAAMHDAGAGRVGEYEEVAFTTEGEGRFRPTDRANPAIGSAGKAERVPEMQVECYVPEWAIGRVLKAARQAHPYDEMAYDLVRLEQPDTRTGLGAVGTLAQPEPLRTFLDRVSRALDAPGLRYVGNPDATIRTVAVCGGSGSDFSGQAMKAGADAFVTADVTYHKFFDVLDATGKPRMALIDAGHYETEAITEKLLQTWLMDRFPGVSFERTRTRTSPMRIHVRGE